MGKKKNKKKRAKRKYKIFNKTQFVDIICNNCLLCGHKPDPSFCYGKIYKKGPKVFINEIYTKLLGYGLWLKNEPDVTIDNSFIMDDFKRIFCRSGICDIDETEIECQNILVCYASFRHQFHDADKRNKKKKKNKKNKSVVFRAYPTFFTSNDKQWKEQIKEILKDGD